MNTVNNTTITITDSQKRSMAISFPDHAHIEDIMDEFEVIALWMGYHRNSIEDAILSKAEQIGENYNREEID